MNILFLLRGTGIGGLEVVTSILANKFVKEGHNVGVFIYRKDDDGHSIRDRFSDKVKVYQYDHYSDAYGTASALSDVIKLMDAHIIINQWGLPLIPIKTACKAIQRMPWVKIISVYHNAPDANGRIQGVTIQLAKTKNPLKRCLLKLKRAVFTKVTSHAMRYNYDHSDKYLVLSESYRKVFQDFTHLKNTPKLGVMTNPITISPSELGSFEDRLKGIDSKEKEIIFVGRLDFVQKRTYRVLDTWSLLKDKHPDWRLTIVGDGPDRGNLEKHAKALNLKRVHFEGFQNPLKYYKRASILMLTSDFEGFPLVLAEAMSFGVVPVVYNSFAAVNDIIDDGKTGVIVDKVDGSFNNKAMAKGVESVIDDFDDKHQMAIDAISKSKEYSLDEIYKRWIKVFDSLNENKTN